MNVIATTMSIVNAAHRYLQLFSTTKRVPSTYNNSLFYVIVSMIAKRKQKETSKNKQ